jgi:hypothetical protein
LGWSSCRWIMFSGAPSRASSSAWACAAGAARNRRRTPARTARRRTSVRTAAPDLGHPRVGSSMMQAAVRPGARPVRSARPGLPPSPTHPSRPRVRGPPLPLRTRIDRVRPRPLSRMRAQALRDRQRRDHRHRSPPPHADGPSQRVAATLTEPDSPGGAASRAAREPGAMRRRSRVASLGVRGRVRPPASQERHYLDQPSLRLEKHYERVYALPSYLR